MTIAAPAAPPLQVQAQPPAQYAPQTVTLVSGESVEVLTAEEAAWFNRSRNNYLKQTAFTEHTDLVDIDRLLTLELLVYRHQQFLFAGADYLGDEVDAKRLVMEVKGLSDQITKLKDAMGLTKKARDDAANEGSLSAILMNLKQRAKIWGVHREKQLDVALTLMNELSTVVGTYDRSDTEERRKMGYESEKDIVDWIRQVMLPEFKSVDEYFREHVQRYWLRSN